MKNEKTKPVEVDHSARAHHPYSPSSLQYLEASPNFVSHDSTNAASEAGTRQHEAVDDPDFENNSDDLTDEQYAAVMSCRVRKQEIVRELAAAAECKPEDVIVLTEQYLPIDGVRLPDGTESTSAGFLDFAAVSPCHRYAAIVDWKFGQWKVTEAEDNLQGITYMLGLLYRFPKLEAVHVEFQMPHLGWETSHVFERGERGEGFQSLYTRVRLVVEKAVRARKTKECVARPNTCCFCGNIASCPIAEKMFGTVAQKLSGELELPSTLQPELLTDPTEAATVMKFAQVCDKWSSAVRRTLSLLAQDDPAYVPEDYRLFVQNDRLLADQDKMIEMLQAAGVTSEAIEGAYKLGLTECEKLLRSVTPRGQKDKVVDDAWKAAEEAGIIGRQPETKIYLKAKRKTAND